MSKFAAFMAQNVEKVENKKVVVSHRFKDENGKPIEWEIRAITSDENNDLMRRATVNVPVQGQRGAMTREMDRQKYVAMMVATSVVFPDLRDAELQDSYGAKTPEELLGKMLYLGEYAELASAVTELSQLDDLDAEVTEAKN